MSKILLYQSEDGRTKMEGFLRLNDRDVLQSAGKATAEFAKAHAEHEFIEFRKKEDWRLESDFDQAVKHLPPPKT